MSEIKRILNKTNTCRFFLLFLIFWTISAHGEVFQGTISQLQVNGNAVYFSLTGASYAECAKNQRYIFNGGTAYGRKLYQLLLDAYSTKKEIAIATLGTCSLSPDDAEDIGNLIITDGNEVE